MANLTGVNLREDGLHNGDHHGRGGRVGDPHGQEHGRHHEPQHQESGAGSWRKRIKQIRKRLNNTTQNYINRIIEWSKICTTS